MSPLRVFQALVIALPVMALACSEAKPSKGAPDPAVVEEGPSDKAIAESTDAIQADPRKADARGALPHHRRGTAYLAKGEHDKAMLDFAEAIRLYPEVKGPYSTARLVEAYNARAEAFVRNHDHDQAAADYTKIIEIGQGPFKDAGEALAFGGMAGMAHYKRGICHDEKGNHAKALADYKEAVELAPDLANHEDLKKRLAK